MPLLSFPEWKCFKAGWDVAKFARGLTLGSAVRGGARSKQESPPTKLRARPALDNLSPLGEGHPLAHVMDPVGCWQPAGGSHWGVVGLLSQRLPGTPLMCWLHPIPSPLPSGLPGGCQTLSPSIQGCQVLCALPVPRPVVLGLAIVAGWLPGMGG